MIAIYVYDKDMLSLLGKVSPKFPKLKREIENINHISGEDF